MNQIISAIEKENMRTDLPDIGIGDTVKVFVKVIEGTRERLQGFEGYVIAKKGRRHQRDDHRAARVVRHRHRAGRSRSIRRRSPVSRRCGVIACGAQSFTICVTEWAKRPN